MAATKTNYLADGPGPVQALRRRLLVLYGGRRNGRKKGGLAKVPPPS